MNKHNILIIGAGKIGLAVASLLARTNDYKVYLGDLNQPHNLPYIADNQIEFIVSNINKPDEITQLIKSNGIKAVISCLPFNLTLEVAKIAYECGIDYFDPTEDVEITNSIKQMATTSASSFAPQCGLAPGFISIATNSLINKFETVENVKMRVGALAQSTSNRLNYAFTWSFEGVINEYIRPCKVIADGREKLMPALSDLEPLILDGVEYEAFHTSGGIGSLVDTYLGRIKNLDYKTMRYPGHCHKMTFLLQDLKLKNNPNLAKQILTNAIPYTRQDKVVIYVSVEGDKDGQLCEVNYTKTIYPLEISGYLYTAIQIATASSICVVVDMVVHEKKLSGFIRQEQISLDEFLANRFGKYYTKS